MQQSQLPIDFHKALDEGVRYNKESQHNKAIETLIPASSFFHEKKDYLEAAQAALHLGSSYFALEKYDEAKVAFKQAIEMASHLEDGDFYLALSHYHLAKAYYASRHYLLAFATQKQAIEIMAGIPPSAEDKIVKKHQIQAGCLLGKWLQAESLYDQAAINYFEQAWNLDAKAFQQLDLQYIAFFFFEKADFAGAAKYFAQMESDFKDPDQSSRFHLFFGIALLKQNKYSTSLSSLTKALNLYRTTASETGQTFASLALAISYYKEKPDLSKQYLAFVNQHIGQCYLRGARHELFILKTLLKDQAKLPPSPEFKQLAQDHLLKAHVWVENLDKIRDNKREFIETSLLFASPGDLQQSGQALSTNTYLQTLTLVYTDNYREADDAEGGFIPTDARAATNQFITSLMRHSSLKFLKVKNISRHLLLTIANYINEAKSLSKFSLEDEANYLLAGDEMLALLSALKKMRALHTLSLETSLESKTHPHQVVTAVVALLNANASLTELSVVDTGLSIVNCQAIMRGIAAHANLQVLRLNNVGNISNHLVLQELYNTKCSLKELVFYHNAKSTATEGALCILALAKIVHKTSSIKRLQISFDFFTGSTESDRKTIVDAITTLAQAFEHNTSICQVSCLHLPSVGSDPSVTDLREKIQHSTSRNQQPKLATPASQKRKFQSSFLETSAPSTRVKGEKNSENGMSRR